MELSQLGIVLIVVALAADIAYQMSASLAVRPGALASVQGVQVATIAAVCGFGYPGPQGRGLWQDGGVGTLEGLVTLMLLWNMVKNQQRFLSLRDSEAAVDDA
ncbi:MAG TPA: hypothetical protein PKA64_08805 [Myxococcota bacterium]|nr:hypothetical protein [Myxococcota bacterium]